MATHNLPDLPFDKTALSPFLSAETFDFHHGKHHAGYVKKLNAALEDSPYAELSLEQCIIKSNSDGDTNVYNNAAQHFNHSFFWNCLSPEGGGEAPQNLKSALEQSFGSVDEFKTKFSETAAKLFGSGWAWLAQSEEGNLEIMALPNADNPLIFNAKPLLTIDVWEHAYYIDYRNARPEFISEFWNVVNWDHIAKQL